MRKALGAFALSVVTGVFPAYCDDIGCEEDIYDEEFLPVSIPDPFPEEEPAGDAVAGGRALKVAAALPERWDARDYGWVASVKKQGRFMVLV